ncbi:MAG TPA: peptidase, partial [Thalassospira lucentensis]|nr:peptidase [Thalassospira lucentensis]
MGWLHSIHKRHVAALFAAATLTVGLAGCSTNRATGEDSFTAFMSPDEERKIGALEHPKMVKEFGGKY